MTSQRHFYERCSDFITPELDKETYYFQQEHNSLFAVSGEEEGDICWPFALTFFHSFLPKRVQYFSLLVLLSHQGKSVGQQRLGVAMAPMGPLLCCVPGRLQAEEGIANNRVLQRPGGNDVKLGQVADGAGPGLDIAWQMSFTVASQPGRQPDIHDFEVEKVF